MRAPTSTQMTTMTEAWIITPHLPILLYHPLSHLTFLPCVLPFLLPSLFYQPDTSLWCHSIMFKLLYPGLHWTQTVTMTVTVTVIMTVTALPWHLVMTKQWLCTACMLTHQRHTTHVKTITQYCYMIHPLAHACSDSTHIGPLHKIAPLTAHFEKMNPL